MNGLRRAAYISAIVLGILALGASAVWFVRDRAPHRTPPLAGSSSWPYLTGAQLLSQAGLDTPGDFVNIGRASSRWPKAFRWMRSDAGWERVGRREADIHNERYALIAVTNPGQARDFALQFALLVKSMRAKPP